MRYESDVGLYDDLGFLVGVPPKGITHTNLAILDYLFNGPEYFNVREYPTLEINDNNDLRIRSGEVILEIVDIHSSMNKVIGFIQERIDSWNFGDCFDVEYE